MKKILLILSVTFSMNIMAQGTASDIPVKDLPADVKSVLVEYVKILRTSASLEDCAKAFIAVAGGGLINESVTNITLRSTIMDFSLKKDFNNIKFYTDPIQITRVNYPSSKITSGYGESAITGRIYKIWIGKANSDNGMPAPVSIMVPEGHSTITKPKVVNIGSL